jgi:hypothetical protein
MTEFAKIASAVKMWGWGRAGMVLAAVLLLKHVVTFDQAVILILVNVVLDRLVYGKQPSPRSTNGRSSGMAQNRRRRPKTIKPIEGQPGSYRRWIACRSRRPFQQDRSSPQVARGTYRKHNHE